MALLALPNEILDAIISELVSSVDVEAAHQYREVCKRFDRQIVDDVSKRVSKVAFVDMFRHPSYKKLFKLHGGKIVSNRMLQVQQDHPVMVFIGRIVSHVLKNQSADGFRSENLRVEYTHKLFQSAMVLREVVLQSYLSETNKIADSVILSPLTVDMPAVAAALGDPWMLLSHVASPTDLLRSSWLFPNAIDAAVASGQTEVLSTVLEYLKNNVEGRPRVDSWDDMREAARAILQGLRNAIRLHKKSAGEVIFKFFADNRIFRESTGKSSGELLVQECIKYCNLDLIRGAIIYQRVGTYDPTNKEQLIISAMSDSEEVYLLNYAPPRALKVLIKDHIFDPNKWIRSKTPLQFVLDNQDYERALILVENGADIHMKNREGRNALWFAASKGLTKAVKMLLESGAEPFEWYSDQSPFVAAQIRGHGRCAYLLKMVYAHGKDFLKRSDIWEGYEE